MWTRKEIKTKAKKNLKRNYWLMIAVCFVLAFVCGEHSASVSSMSQKTEKQTENVSDDVVYSATDGGNWGVVSDVVGSEQEQKETKTDVTIQSLFNQFTEEHSMLFDAMGAAGATVKSDWAAAIILLAAAVGSTLFTCCIIWPVLIGGKRYYLDVSEGLEGLKVNILGCIFRKGIYRNTIKIMFFKWLKLTLWWFTIIGGFIKYYEYSVIPFILAENPRLTNKEAFALAHDMMVGNKWKLFKLDVSFIGWLILSMATFGLVAIFFVNPYQALTVTEAYVAIRDEAVLKNPELYKPLVESTF